MESEWMKDGESNPRIAHTQVNGRSKKFPWVSNFL
jgi:hypothetical protein